MSTRGNTSKELAKSSAQHKRVLREPPNTSLSCTDTRARSYRTSTTGKRGTQLWERSTAYPAECVRDVALAQVPHDDSSPLRAQSQAPQRVFLLCSICGRRLCGRATREGGDGRSGEQEGNGWGDGQRSSTTRPASPAPQRRECVPLHAMIDMCSVQRGGLSRSAPAAACCLPAETTGAHGSTATSHQLAVPPNFRSGQTGRTQSTHHVPQFDAAVPRNGHKVPPCGRKERAQVLLLAHCLLPVQQS